MLVGRDMTQSQRAAVAVEQASFYEHGGDRTQESFKVSNDTLNELAESEAIPINDGRLTMICLVNAPPQQNRRKPR